MKIKLTNEQAVKLHTLLNENGTEDYAEEIGELLRSQELYAVWDQLDEKLRAGGIDAVAL